MDFSGRTVGATAGGKGRVAAALTVVALALSLAGPALAQGGGSGSGTIEDAGRVLEWQVSGMEVGETAYSSADRCWTGPITVTDTTVTFSGTMRASVADDMVSTGAMSAYLYNTSTGEKQQLDWPDPAQGESGDLGKPGPLTHEETFSFSVSVAPGQVVWATANVSLCGGVCDTTSLCLFAPPAPEAIGAPAVETATPPPTATIPPTATATAVPTATPAPSWVGVAAGAGGAGLLAVAGLAAAAAAVAAARSRGRRLAQPAQYILQVSSQRLQLEPEAAAQLTIQAWRVTPEGGYRPAPEAALSVGVPAGLVVTPVEGAGTLACQVRAAADADPGEYRLLVTGRAGSAELRTEVMIVVEDEYEVEIF